jgi:uncharacterized protein
VGATAGFAVRGARVGFDAGAEARDVDVDVRLLRTNRGILASVHTELTLAMPCSRCLVEVSRRLAFDFEEEYLPVIDVLTGAPLRFDDETDAFRIDEHHILDLTEAIRQYGLGAVPMAPLCSETCRGLCPECGTDLNTGRCDCAAPVDERWGALNALMNRQSSHE